MKKMLITGASGFLGSRVSKYFSDKYVVYTPSHQEMDITQENDVQRIVKTIHPDVIIHCAAMADVGQCQREPETSWKINVMGSIYIAKSAKEIGAKCILCSSDQVYFPTPTNIYAKEKATAETEGLSINPDCVFLRLTWMYDPNLTSPTQHSDFFTNLLPKLSTEETVSYALLDKRGITNIHEVIVNIEKAINIPGGIYDFGAPNTYNMYETVVNIFSSLGLDINRVIPNTESFKENPRDITVKQEEINNWGIYFTDTTEALVQNFKKYIQQTCKRRS